MDFDSEDEDIDTDSDSNRDWRMLRQWRSYRDDVTADGGGNREVRRSPRLAAQATQATPQTARRTSRRQASNPRPQL